MSSTPVICLFGFGEVGQTLAQDLRERGHRDLVAWDIAFADAASPQRAMAASGLARLASSAHEAVANADVVICAVTAANCTVAAGEAGAALRPRAFFMDLNSVAPVTREHAAKVISDHGGRYIEAAVMAPIGPRGIATSMLLGGPHVVAFAPLAGALGFVGAHAYSESLGKASAAKMCRSVMIKGVEALLTESLLAARRYGVDDAVLDSLRDLFPGIDWPTLGSYMISRSLQHGRRRAEEMREVARAVRDAGVEPLMSLATASRQDWAAGLNSHADGKSLTALLDSLLAAIPTRAEKF